MNDVLARTEYPHHSKLSVRTYLTPRFAQVFHLVRCPMQQISAFTSHLNASYDFVRKHMLQQIKQHQPQLLYRRTHRDRGRKTIHSNNVNDVVDKSNRRLRKREEQQHYSNTSNIRMYEEEDNSLWMSRNHAQFFRDRKLLVSSCSCSSSTPLVAHSYRW